MMRHLQAALIALVVLGVALLTWAGQQRPADPYLEAIRARGVLRVGMDPTYPPFDTLDGGKPAGYDVALAEEVAAGLGVRAEFSTLALDTLYDALASGQVDLLASALPFVYERQKEVRYSAPYYQAGQVIVTRVGGGPMRGVSDLAAREVAVELGSNADTEARRLQRTTIATMRLDSSYRSAEEALDAVVRGEADAAITDNLSAQQYLARHQGSLAVAWPALTDEPYVLAMPAGAHELAARANATIERLRASGELARMMGEAR